MPKAKSPSPKIHKVMSEFKSGDLHSGSKKGPVVTSQKQAVAIAMSEARKNPGEGHSKPAPAPKVRKYHY